MSKQSIFNCTVDDLMRDIRDTNDPIRKTILKKFLDLKIRELRAVTEDPSLDGISDNESVDDILADGISDQRLKNKELDVILKNQKDSISELDKLHKIKAYAEMIEDNKKEKDTESIETHRGKTERVWGTTYDPRYTKYAKEDTMNNKVMERLNSEIDFRNDDGKRSHIEKPFDDGDPDATEPYARYEETVNEKKKYVPKNKHPEKIGQRISFY